MASRALARTDPGAAEILDDLVREWSRELENTYDLRGYRWPPERWAGMYGRCSPRRGWCAGGAEGLRVGRREGRPGACVLVLTHGPAAGGKAEDGRVGGADAG